MAVAERLPALPAWSDMVATGRFVAGLQRPDGGIPWSDGGHLDPWDHVEAAMALSATGFRDAAEAAYGFCAATQRADGTWPMVLRDGVAEDAGADSNQVAYVAVGVWHHWLVTRDRAFVGRLWPTVVRACDFVLSVQREDGALAWAVDAAGRPDDSTALLTGCSSAAQALRCAVALANVLGEPTERYRVAAARLDHAVRAHPEAFADRGRFSMDWYYPVLGGSVRGDAGRRRLARDWARFVVPGWGIRCVDDRPWVTGAESCELVLALDAVGERARAVRVLADVAHLRHDDDGYWTGYVYADEAVWPVERTAWTAAAVVLATDALGRHTPGSGVFRDAAAPADRPDLLRCSASACEEALG